VRPHCHFDGRGCVSFHNHKDDGNDDSSNSKGSNESQSDTIIQLPLVEYGPTILYRSDGRDDDNSIYSMSMKIIKMTTIANNKKGNADDSQSQILSIIVQQLLFEYESNFLSPRTTTRKSKNSKLPHSST